MDEIFFDEKSAESAMRPAAAESDARQNASTGDLTGENKFLGEQNIFKLLIKFSIPCILSLLVGALYNIVDQIFIGNSSLHELGNAATGVCFPLTLIAMAFAWGFGDGTAAYLSICQGRKDTEDSHRAVGGAMTMTLLFSLILVAVLIPLRTPISRVRRVGQHHRLRHVVLCDNRGGISSVYGLQHDDGRHTRGRLADVLHAVARCGSGDQHRA